MKTRFWVDLRLTLILIMAAALVSCAAVSSGAKVSDWIAEATALSSSGDFDEALAVYDKAIAKSGDYRLRYNRAVLLATMGRLDEAIDYCTSCFAEYPHIIRFLTARTSFLMLTDRTEDTKASFEEVLSLDPYDSGTKAKYEEFLKKADAE